jgi:hypothetical protein
MIEGGYHAVGIELEVVGLELVAGRQIELDNVERQSFAVEHEAHPLRTGRLRRVIERKGHGVSP